AEPDRTHATMLRNKSTTVPQGTMIPAVLETALNSDLPGFTRAVVSRDVRSFDGSVVLIPRGSRVIGQYKSAAAQGQSRAFVVWTRILRPDGGSIQIGSAGADELGRAGMAGKVDRHFFEQFSGAILLTVLEGGLTALSNNPSTTVVVGSSGSGLSTATSALTPQAIPPTIRVAQGSPIRIFVARDLDFTALQNAGQ
ncbi:MAG: type IV secretion system protein VirB10, partial [Caulobacteraceae bacterium]